MLDFDLDCRPDVDGCGLSRRGDLDLYDDAEVLPLEEASLVLSERPREEDDAADDCLAVCRSPSFPFLSLSVLFAGLGILSSFFFSISSTSSMSSTELLRLQLPAKYHRTVVPYYASVSDYNVHWCGQYEL